MTSFGSPAYTHLKTILTYLLSGRAENHTTNVQKIVDSLEKHISRAVTKSNGSYENILICMTVRCLFRS